MIKILNNQGKIKIEDKSNEDVDLLKIINKILIERRGYVVKLPKPGETVVACMSGGLDSTANIGILLKELKLNVYPFFINRGQSALKWERKAVKFFDKFFKERFPEKYHRCLEIEVLTPAREYKNLLRRTKKAMTNIPLSQNISYPARNPIIFLTGAEYAYSLRSKGENIKTIFASHVSSDGSFHCSLTWTRIMNLLMCQIFNDWSFQFISLPIELEFGNYFDKDVYIRFMVENKIPIEKTRTCTTASKIPCGDCPPCWDTRRILKELGIKDKRKYLFQPSQTFPTYYTHEKELKLLLKQKQKNEKRNRN